MTVQQVITIGNETTVKLDRFIIRCSGNHIEVFKRGLFHKKLWEHDEK